MEVKIFEFLNLDLNFLLGIIQHLDPTRLCVGKRASTLGFKEEEDTRGCY